MNSIGRRSTVGKPSAVLIPSSSLSPVSKTSKRARDLPSIRTSLLIATGLACVLLLATFGALSFSASSGSSWSYFSKWLKRRRQYCEPGEVPGHWEEPQPSYPGFKYIMQGDTCKHEYIFGRERLEHHLRSGLRIEIWGDASQSQVVGSLMCWLSGATPWNPTARVLNLPRSRPWKVNQEDMLDKQIFWKGKTKCFNGSPEAEIKTCVDLLEEKYERKQVWDTDLLDECRFERLEFSWMIPRSRIQRSEAFAPKYLKSKSVWIPPTLTFRWVGKAQHLAARVVNWMEANPNRVYEADLLILSAGNVMPRKGTDQEFVEDLQVFFSLLHENMRYFKNTHIVWMEATPVGMTQERAEEKSDLLSPDTDGDEQSKGDARFRSLQGVKLAEEYGLAVLRTSHLLESYPKHVNQPELRQAAMSEHRAQLILNYLAHKL